MNFCGELKNKKNNMKYVEFKLGKNIVEFHNSIFGKESVLNNG